MNDPRRLAEQDQALAALLGAARGYRAPPRMRRRVLRMLGLPVALSLAGLASSASAGVLAVLSKVSLPTWIVAGAVAAVGGGGVVAYRLHQAEPVRTVGTVADGVVRTRRPPVRSAPLPPLLPDSTDVPPAQRAPRVSLPPTRASERLAATPRARRAVAVSSGPRGLPLPAAAAPAPGPTAPPRAQPPALSPPPLPAIVPARRTTDMRTTTLGEELAMLAAADREIRGNGAERALAVLKQYQQRFPGGSLRDEAAVLEIEAQLGAGHSQAASTQARRFLAERPTSVFAPRVRGMLAAAAVRQQRTSAGHPTGQRRQDP